jgi:hypothetical protein
MKDFSKAFDKLQPSLLLEKLLHFGINPRLIDIIESFLTNRCQRVTVNNTNSSCQSILVGAPQGTRLGPWLWLAFVDDLQPPEGSTVKYADDITTYIPVPKKVPQRVDPLQSALEYSRTWCNVNSMTLNACKTLVLNVSLSARSGLDSVPTIDGTPITKIVETKLLGVVFDEMLSFSSHIQKIVNKCAGLNFFLYSLKRLNVSTTGLLTFYISKVRSNIAYACSVWYPLITVHDRQRLQKIERWSLRIIFPQSESYNDRILNSGLIPLLEYLDVLVDNHFNRIVNNKTHPLNQFLVRKIRHRDKCSTFLST